MNRISWITLTAVMAIAAALRLAYLLENSHEPDFAFPMRDAAYHHHWAVGLASQRWDVLMGYPDPEIRSHPYFRPPGYAFFLASIHHVFRSPWWAPRVVQALLGILNVLLAFQLGRKWFGTGVGLLFATLLAVDWHFIYFEGELLDPTLVTTLSLTLILLLARLLERLSVGWALASGLVLGFAALVRPNLLPFGLPAVLWMTAIGWRRQDWKRTLAAITAFALGVALSIAPITLRNLLVTGDPVLICSNGGVNLFLGNNPRANGIDPAGPGIWSWTSFDYPQVVRSLEQQLGHPLTYSQASSYYASEALRWMRQSPAAALGLTTRKALLFWGPREINNEKEQAIDRQHSPLLRRLPFPFTATAALGLVGAVLSLAELRRRRLAAPLTEWNRRQLAVGLLIGLFVLTCFVTYIPFFADTRFRMPVLPFLLLAAAIAVIRIASLWRAGHRRQSLLWIAASLGLSILAAVEFIPHPDRPERWHADRGICLARASQWEAATAEFEKALAIRPDEFAARFGMGTVCLETQRYEEALRHFSAAARVNDRVEDVHLARFVTLMRMNRRDEAANALKDVIRVNPANDMARTSLATTRAGQGRMDEAILHFSDAVRINPANIRARLGLGYALMSKKRYDAAIEQFLEVLILSPGHSMARQALQNAEDLKQAPPDSETGLR